MDYFLFNFSGVQFHYTMSHFVNGAIKKTHLFAILALTSKRVEVIIVKEYI